jgi:hypothetical protein
VYKFFFIGLAFLFLVSCGIEDYIYLEHIPDSNVSRTTNTKADVVIPAVSSPYLRRYIVFYRIYISGVDFPSEITNPGTQLDNSTLTSNFNTLRPYADATYNVSASQVGSVFNSLRYSELEVESASMQNLLGAPGGVFPGASLSFEFIESAPSGNIPYLIMNGTSVQYSLRRNWTVYGYSPPPGAPSAFQPEPDNTFTRTGELCDTGNSISNWDVAHGGGGTNAYVSLYIVAQGTDPNFNAIYSRPTFLGIFRLPD